MSATIKLHHVLESRKNMTVLQTVLQSNRAKLVEKQEAQITLLRQSTNHAQAELQTAVNHVLHMEGREDSFRERITQLQDVILHAGREQRRTNDRLKELVDNYWALLDDCIDVGNETKENSRGHKRKLPAAEELKKIKKIIGEHNSKRARMIVDAMTGAGSSTDRR